MKKIGTKREREARRLVAAQLFARGMGVCEVARVMGVTQGAASHWKKALKERGKDGLLSKPNPGGKSRMTDQQRAELVEMMLAGPTAAGFDTELWTLPRVAQAIEARFGISYEPSHVWRILDKLGFSAQKPERVAREQDEAAVTNFRERIWKQIKKKRTGKT